LIAAGGTATVGRCALVTAGNGGVGVQAGLSAVDASAATFRLASSGFATILNVGGVISKGRNWDFVGKGNSGFRDGTPSAGGSLQPSETGGRFAARNGICSVPLVLLPVAAEAACRARNGSLAALDCDAFAGDEMESTALPCPAFAAAAVSANGEICPVNRGCFVGGASAEAIGNAGATCDWSGDQTAGPVGRASGDLRKSKAAASPSATMTAPKKSFLDLSDTVLLHETRLTCKPSWREAKSGVRSSALGFYRRSKRAVRDELSRRSKKEQKGAALIGISGKLCPNDAVCAMDRVCAGGTNRCGNTG